jgi:hypothetical protein
MGYASDLKAPAACPRRARTRTDGPVTARGERHPVACRLLVAILSLGSASLGASGCRRRPSAGALATTGELSGLVVNEDARPLVAVSLELGHDPPDGRVPLAATRTDKSGEFRIHKLPAGRFRLTARSHEYLRAALPVDIRPAQLSRVRLILGRGVPLAGTVEDERGSPVPLARILALPFARTEDAAAPVAATADAQGRFRVARLPPGAYRLLIEAPGLGTSAAGPVDAPDEAVRVVLAGISRAVVGRVMREGRTVAGARVTLAGEGLSEVRRGETDTQGGFAFAGLGPGTYTLGASVGGWVSGFMPVVITERALLPKNKATAVTLDLRAALFLRGAAVDESRRGIAGAQVLIDSIPATGLVESPSTDGKGNWSSGALPPGTYRMEARKAGFVCARTLRMQLGAEPPTKPIDSSGGVAAAPGAASAIGDEVRLELLRTGELRGRIVDACGAPLRDARVRNQLASAEDLGVIFAPLPMAAEAAALPMAHVLVSGYAARKPARGGGGGGALGEPSGDTLSDDEGRFRMTDVPPGRVRLEIVRAGSVPLRTAASTLAPGQTRDLGTIRLQAAMPLTGHVLDGDGVAVPGALLTATASTRAGAAESLDFFAATDDAGAFSLPLPPGQFRVGVTAAGKRPSALTVDIGAAAITPVTFRLSSAVDTTTVAIDGVVKDVQGRPLAGATIALLVAPPGGQDQDAASRPASALTPPTRSDAGGHFRLDASLPGEVAAFIEVSHPLYPRVRHPLTDARIEGDHGTLAVEVPIPGAIRGEVHERVTGGPVPYFEVQASGPDGARSHFPEAPRSRRGPSRTSDVFQFQLTKLLPGRWTLRVTGPGHEPLERIIDVPSAGTAGDFSVRDLRIEL